MLPFLARDCQDTLLFIKPEKHRALLCPVEVPSLVPWQPFPGLLTQGIVIPGTAEGRAHFSLERLTPSPRSQDGAACLTACCPAVTPSIATIARFLLWMNKEGLFV